MRWATCLVGQADWLDKVRVGVWLAYNTLHKEFFRPKFRIDQRLETKDRIAIISVDALDHTKGFGIGGTTTPSFGADPGEYGLGDPKEAAETLPIAGPK
jgi:hypothetical protein